ncbi:MAG: 5'-methylthioadenosine/S-adenosylhomocysteine nucleosidase [Okeania sp. SIO3B5]|uniref:phosphorylase family protein n=1 Tax=Okeania sp. SIO3B5 TaxID=2607811 RepID=UPI0013FEDF38|nr:hypothetical protein [Okeania sp. SIO3B5]NEO53440.1 5'-methylthioadenosine/S-adenosylhomocysteine nucleosidase [Okeania sp. SIO3B5]
MTNSRIFSDLPQDDLIQLERLLENIFIDIDGISGRRGILRNAGIDKYFIANLYFNLDINEFITILVSKFKDYSVSSRKADYHPLMALLDYLLKQPEKYNLEETDIEIANKIISIGKRRIKELNIGELKIGELNTEISVPTSPPNNPSPISSRPDTKPPSSTIDILIITALKDELDALKNCDNQSGNTWQEFKDSSNFPYYKTTLNHKNGTQLNILAARPPEMGENYTNNLATRLISELKPSCLAMTGVCAGNKEKKVFLGDVIVAKEVFKFDYGKLVAYYESIDNQQIRNKEIFHEIRTYNLNFKWKLAIEDFPQDWLNTIKTPRPKSYYHQERWLLHKLYNFQQQPDKYSSPDQHPERQTECPDWREAIQRLKKQELLKTDSLELTEKAVKEIKNERLEYLENQRYKDPLNPEIHPGVIATTSKVQKDPQLFQRIEKLQRKILGVEMEGAAIGVVGAISEIPIIIVKGVQDYADHDKNDQFREYAAEVSARFLLAFFTTISVDLLTS